MRIPLRAADLAHWGVTRQKWVVESTRHDILVGASAADIRGTSVQATEAGAWIRFRDVDLRRGVRGIEVRVANPAAASGRIEVRLDDPASGRVLGTVSVPSTGEKYTCTSVRADLDPARGRHDLVLAPDEPVILASLRLLR